MYDPILNAKDRLQTLINDASHAFSALESRPEVQIRDKIAENVLFTTDLFEALANVDFVQENCPEEINIKTELYATMEKVLPKTTPIFTSTSGLTVSAMACAFTHPERFAVAHPFNPPHLIPLVEIVGGPSTSQETIDFAMDFYKSIGKQPIHVKKEVPGHIANRLQSALFREIMHLIDDDVATIADIEKAMMYGPGLRWGVMGPSTLFHLGGGNGQGGGVEHFSKHIMKPMLGWYAQKDPVFDEELRAKWVQQTEKVVDSEGLGFGELCRKRDEGILEILKWQACRDNETQP